jgi:hypothetical protein
MTSLDLSQRIDALYEKRKARLEAQRLLDKQYEEELEELAVIKTTLQEFEWEDWAGSRAHVYLKPTEEPDVNDWLAFQAHIRSSGELDLLQKRPMVSAIKARWQEGRDVPGVVRVHDIKAVLGAIK